MIEHGMTARPPWKLLVEHFQGKQLSDEFSIQANARPLRFVEQAIFDLRLLKGQDNVSSIDPVFSGIFSLGRPSQFIAGWIDGDYFQTATFPSSDTIALSENNLDSLFFKIVGDLIPPGGSFMVSYSLFSKESKIHKETRQGLDKGYPPVVTPLGFLLFQAGCGMGFKDWYFSEGGREGPEKLQGFKPINFEVAKRKAESMSQELHRFQIIQSDDDEFTQACRARAEYVIRELQNMR
jgi:hypothetical protein